MRSSFVFTVWRPNKEYYFDIHGRHLTGLQELKEQYSGIIFKGKLIVQAIRRHELLMKVSNHRKDQCRSVEFSTIEATSKDLVDLWEHLA